MLAQILAWRSGTPGGESVRPGRGSSSLQGPSSLAVSGSEDETA